MAKPIAPTPILEGKEAEEFIRKAEYPGAKMAPKIDFETGKKLFDAFFGKKSLKKHAL